MKKLYKPTDLSRFFRDQTIAAVLICSSANLLISASALAQGAWTQKANFGEKE